MPNISIIVVLKSRILAFGRPVDKRTTGISVVH
jgi:hypothetical protein